MHMSQVIAVADHQTEMSRSLREIVHQTALSVQPPYPVMVALSACRATRVAGFRPGSRYPESPRVIMMMRKLAIASLLVAGVALSGSVLAQAAAPQAAPAPAPMAAPAAQATPAAHAAEANEQAAMANEKTAKANVNAAEANEKAAAPKTAKHHHHRHHKSHKAAAAPAAASTAG
jgi:hypothetical protein